MSNQAEVLPAYRLQAKAAVEAINAGALAVDVRSEGGRERDGELRVAVVIPKTDVVEALTKRLARTSPDQKIVVFCTSVNGSQPIVEKLQGVGVHNVYDVDGGFAALVAQGLAKIPRPTAK